MDASDATATDFAGAGFISDISGGTMSLTGVTVSGTTLKNAASSHSGGFLGMQWLGTDVSFTANNGVTVSGTKVFTSVKLDPEAVDPDDVEMLQDMIVAAANEALKKVDEEQASQMGSLTGGMGGLGGLGF